MCTFSKIKNDRARPTVCNSYIDATHDNTMDLVGYFTNTADFIKPYK